MRLQDILISVIVLSLTIVTILLQYNLIKVYELRSRLIPLELFAFAEEIHLEKLLYSQYLTSKNYNDLFYLNISVLKHFKEDEDVEKFFYCPENCPIKKYFSVSCGTIKNVSKVEREKEKERIKLKIYVDIYRFCFSPAYIVRRLSTYLDGEKSENRILSIYSLEDIAAISASSKTYTEISWNYKELVETIKKLKEGGEAFTGVFNAKISMLLTDNYGRLYKIYPISLGSIGKIKSEEKAIS